MLSIRDFIHKEDVDLINLSVRGRILKVLLTQNVGKELALLWCKLYPLYILFFRKKLKKSVSSNHNIGLGCPIGEFVNRRQPMLFITGVDSVAKTITKSEEFSSRKNLWGFNIPRRKTHFAKPNSLSMTIFTTKIACNSVTTIKTMNCLLYTSPSPRD